MDKGVVTLTVSACYLLLASLVGWIATGLLCVRAYWLTRAGYTRLTNRVRSTA